MPTHRYTRPLLESPAHPWWPWCVGHQGLGIRHVLWSIVVVALLAANAWKVRSVDVEASPSPTPLQLQGPTVAVPTSAAAVNMPADPARARMPALMRTPWATWLAAFEVHLPQRATLAAIETDAQSQRVEVQALADDLQTLLDFGQALEASPQVRRVEPQAHLPDPEDHAPQRMRMRWRITLQGEAKETP